MEDQDYKRVEHLGKTSIVIKFYKAMRWCWTHKLPFLAKIIWRLNHIGGYRLTPLLVLEHILTQIIELNNTQQMSKVVNNWEYISACRGDYRHHITQC